MADHDTHDHTGIPGCAGSDDLDAIIAASAGQDIADALAGAASPDAGNVFATMADIGGGGGDVTIVGGFTAAVDQGAIGLVLRRATANTEDDLFDATSLDAKWVAYTGFNPTTSLTVRPGWLQITSAGYKLQAVPAGDWTVETEVISGDLGAAGYQDAGLILTSGTTLASATDARLGIGQRNSLTQYRYVFEKFVNGAFSTAYQETSIDNLVDHMFLRINKSGTTYTAEYSTTGFTWHRIVQTGSLGFTPTHFGVGGDSSSFFNGFYRY